MMFKLRLRKRQRKQQNGFKRFIVCSKNYRDRTNYDGSATFDFSIFATWNRKQDYSDHDYQYSNENQRHTKRVKSRRIYHFPSTCSTLKVNNEFNKPNYAYNLC